MSLITLAYVSSALQPMAAGELTELLADSRRRNREVDVTGILLYRDGNFLQVLEGEEETIQNLRRRIAADPRHRGMIVLLVKALAERAFADWSMAFVNLDDPETRKLPGYSDYLVRPLTADGIGGELAPLLASFRKNLR